jgi:hypothetical protein
MHDARLAPILAAIGDHQTQAQQARATVDLARSLPCETAEQYSACGEFLRQAQQQLGYYEKARKRLTRPLLQAKQEVDGIFKPITTAMAQVKAALAAKLKAYDLRAEQERRAALAAIEQAHAQRNQAAVEHHAQALQAPPPSLQGVHTRKRWTYRVTDAALVPRQFLMVDDRLVRNAIKAGARVVPGLEIFEETSVVARG